MDRYTISRDICSFCGAVHSMCVHGLVCSIGIGSSIAVVDINAFLWSALVVLAFLVGISDNPFVVCLQTGPASLITQTMATTPIINSSTNTEKYKQCNRAPIWPRKPTRPTTPTMMVLLAFQVLLGLLALLLALAGVVVLALPADMWYSHCCCTWW